MFKILKTWYNSKIQTICSSGLKINLINSKKKVAMLFFSLTYQTWKSAIDNLERGMQQL